MHWKNLLFYVYRDDDPVVHAMQNYSSKASYVTLQKKSGGQWNIEFHKVDYDVQSAMNAAQSQSSEDWVHFLSTGRA